MDKIYFHIDNPNLLYTKILINETQRRRMVECILAQKDIANYHGGYTFEILDPYHDFADLYSKFVEITENTFGPFRYSVKQKHWCWANVYNCDSNRTNMHDHQTTSTINAVYYLNIPNLPEGEGRLEILHEGKVDYFTPETGDLIIMPSWLPHQPCDHSSKEYRIAINMEISTVESVDELYTLERIYQRCNHA